jgi:hypothetical protein
MQWKIDKSKIKKQVFLNGHTCLKGNVWTEGIYSCENGKDWWGDLM